MREQEIRLEKLTRREFRTALAAEHYQVAILPTGASSSTWSTSRWSKTSFPAPTSRSRSRSGSIPT